MTGPDITQATALRVLADLEKQILNVEAALLAKVQSEMKPGARAHAILRADERVATISALRRFVSELPVSTVFERGESDRSES